MAGVLVGVVLMSTSMVALLPSQVVVIGGAWVNSLMVLMLELSQVMARLAVFILVVPNLAVPLPVLSVVRCATDLYSLPWL